MKVISKLTAGYAQYLTLPPLSPFDYFRVTGKVSSLWEIDDCQMVLTEDCNSSSWAEKTSSQRTEELRLANYQKRCSPLSKILVIPALSGDQKSLFPPQKNPLNAWQVKGVTGAWAHKVIKMLDEHLQRTISTHWIICEVLIPFLSRLLNITWGYAPYESHALLCCNFNLFQDSKMTLRQAQKSQMLINCQNCCKHGIFFNC